MQKLIKNAIVYSAVLPEAHHLAIHLAELPYEPIGDTQLSRSSFVPNKVTNELVTEFNGGYSFSLRYDEKILPKAIIQAKALERIATAEFNHGGRLSKVERLAILDDVVVDLAKTALVKTAVITAFYRIADQLLIVPVSGKSLANVVVSNLIKVVGSVKTTTIHIDDIKNGLTTRLKSHLGENPAALTDEGFELGERVSLVKPGESVNYNLEDLTTASAAILDRFEKGFTVKAIGLVSNEIAFNLTADFHFKSIKFGIELESQDGDDVVFMWKQEAAVQSMLLTKVVRDLCRLLGYKPPQDEEAETAEAAE